MSHPPLCPSAEDPISMPTDDVWYICTKDKTLGFGICLKNKVERRMIARYQACAWMDRMERWWTVWRYAVNKKKHDVQFQFFAHAMARDSENMAIEWREWEKQK